MKTTAAILVETGKPLVLEELVIPPLQRGQALVQILYSGVCHTQVLEARGYKGPDPFLPHCMGHEGTAVVVDVGEGVTRVKTGDNVLLSWIKASGADVPGSRYESARGTVNAGGVTTFSHYAVVSENRMTRLPATIDLTAASLLGCAAATGLGAVFNTLAASSGDSIAILGVGGIGLCAVAAAKIAGCTPIIAVDVNPSKLEVARQFGATHVMDASTGDINAGIRAVVPKGVDLAVEASGRPAVMALSLEIVRQQGGRAVVIGNARADERLTFDPKQLNMGKQLRGTWGGDTMPDRDFPKYFELLQDGQIPLHLLSSKMYSLRDINNALDDLEGGRVVRPVINPAI